MSRQEIEAVVAAYRSALEDHDLETAMGLLADDIVHHVTGRNATSGTFQGKARFQQTYDWLFREHDAGIDVAAFHDVLFSDDHAVALVEERAHRGERTVRYRRVMIFHVRNHKISEIWTIAHDPYELDQFWE